MHCPFCRHDDTRVVDSRLADEGGAIRRRRQCPACERRFTTVEKMTMAVVKRAGVTEPFSRSKVVAGVRRACQGRGVSEDELARLAQQVEDELRAGGAAEIPSNEVGLAILGPLRMLDEVAYLRFASVYRSFESLADFESEISMLRSDGHQPMVDRSSQNPQPTQTTPASQAAQTTQTTQTSQATQTS
ncbi:MAG TPA: transcriptional regulator NrdR [Jiangellaceae bacterium]|nr:transcriptional regulator NrdR [Jiangellaceae bacterium]